MLTAVADRPLNYLVRVENRTAADWPATGPDGLTVLVLCGPAAGGQFFELLRTAVLADITAGTGANISVHIPNPPPPGEWTLVHRLERMRSGPGGFEFARLPLKVSKPSPTGPLGRPAGANVIGHLASEKGIGEAARSLVRGLVAAEVPHALVPIPEGGSDDSAGEFEAAPGEPPYSVNLISSNPDGLPHVLWHLRPDFAAGRYTVGYWFWELPKLPREWERAFPTVQEIWAASRFTQRAIAAVSPVPVVYMPLALNPAPPAGVLSRATLGIPADAFVVLFVFDAASSLARKNPAGLIRAFRTAFPNDAGARLILKFARGDKYPAAVSAALAAAEGDLRVLAINGVWPRGHVRDLIELCDCYASLHRSEGFGLTCAEAMAAGKPVIATDWSGTTDFVTPSTGFPVRRDEVPILTDDMLYRRGDVWAEPDLSQAADLLRQVRSDPAAAQRIANAGRAFVNSHFTPARVGEAISDRFAALARLGRIRPLGG